MKFLASTSAIPTPPIPPVASPRILILLYSILLCSFVDLSLSLINLGLTSFFIGLAATGAALIHILTNLFIIIYRLRRPLSSTSQRSNYHEWEAFPPTSKLSNITMDLILAALFIAAFTTTLLVHIMHYFSGGNHGERDSWFNRGTSPLKGPKGVIYADAVMELLCGILLIALAVVGSSERRWFQEVTRKSPLGDGT